MEKHVLELHGFTGITFQVLTCCALLLPWVVWIIVYYALRRKRIRGNGDIDFLNFIRQFTIPCAVFTKRDFYIRYLNPAFATIWSLTSEDVGAAEHLYTANNASLLAALKDLNAQRPTLNIEHTIGSGYNQVHYNCIFQYLEQGDGYIMQTMHDITHLKTYNSLLEAEINVKKLALELTTEELMLTGQELESCYLSLETANTLLLKILGEKTAGIDADNIGY